MTKYFNYRDRCPWPEILPPMRPAKCRRALHPVQRRERQSRQKRRGGAGETPARERDRFLIPKYIGL